MEVRTAAGHYRGLQRPGVWEFRGVPFAKPPTGERRFKSPQPLSPGDDQITADKLPMPSLQVRSPIMGVTESSEDCLYLNIWVPEGPGPFPIMVWFHGGAYLAGSISQPLYQGAALARSQQAIVVNAAYRLGAMGFADFTRVAPELEADTNLGLRDQIAALEWVQANAGAMNGKADQVTVFGESAGGFSVCSLLACPAARPLFHNAIVQSGGADFALAPDQVENVTRNLVEALPGDGAAADKIRNATPKQWLKAQNQAIKGLLNRGLRETTPQFAMNFLPMVDGELLPELPIDAIAKGRAADKRVMAGVCREEFNLFQYAGVLTAAVTMDRLRELDDVELRRRFERALPGNGDAAWAYYRERVTPHPQRSALDILSAMESDRLFRVPTLRLLDAQYAHNEDCWGFQFTWPSEPFGTPLGACHGVDIPFVFGITDSPAGQYFTGGGDAARQLSEQVQQAWGAFAHGHPAPWATWRAAGRHVQQFGPGEPMAPLLDNAGELLWETLIPVP